MFDKKKGGRRAAGFEYIAAITKKGRGQKKGNREGSEGEEESEHTSYHVCTYL